MTSAYESIVVGVISGILTSVLLYVISLFIKNVILPWYQSLIYKGANISGTWKDELDLPDGFRQVSTIVLSQKAHNVVGTISSIKMHDGEISRNDHFLVSGKLQDRILHCVAYPEDSHRIGRVVMLLEIVGEGSILRGQVAWYDAGASIVISKDMELTRP